MVAYGVLEMKHKDAHLQNPGFLELVSKEERDAEAKADFERDQLRKLVREELARYGMLLTRVVLPKHQSWRTKANEHILYGQIEGIGFPARQVLHQGSFKECCLKAAELLDELDKSQEIGT